MKEKYRQGIIETLSEQPHTADELKEKLGGKKHILAVITEMYRRLNEIVIVGSKDGKRVYGLPSHVRTVQQQSVKTGTNPFQYKTYHNPWLKSGQTLRGTRY